MCEREPNLQLTRCHQPTVLARHGGTHDTRTRLLFILYCVFVMTRRENMSTDDMFMSKEGRSEGGTPAQLFSFFFFFFGDTDAGSILIVCPALDNYFSNHFSNLVVFLKSTNNFCSMCDPMVVTVLDSQFGIPPVEYPHGGLDTKNTSFFSIRQQEKHKQNTTHFFFLFLSFLILSTLSTPPLSFTLIYPPSNTSYSCLDTPKGGSDL